MRITEIQELTVKLDGAISNAMVSFAEPHCFPWLPSPATWSAMAAPWWAMDSTPSGGLPRAAFCVTACCRACAPPIQHPWYR